MLRRDRLTRREMLGLSASTLLSAGLWPGSLRAEGQSSPGAFHFAVVNDVHYFDEKCGQWFAGILREMKARPENIAFCVVAGDLSENGKPTQLEPMRDLLKQLGKPTYVVVGNHDYAGPEDRTAYENLFPQQLNYHFEHNGWQFVALDTTQGQRFHGTSVQPQTLHWLDETLPKLDPKRPTVVVTHFPLGPLVITRPENAEPLLARFKPYNLQAVFSGHYHAFTERQVGKVIFTTNRCCSLRRENHDGSKEKGYFLCEAKDGTIRRTFIEVKVG